MGDLGEEAGAGGRCRGGVVLLSMAVVGSSFAEPRGLGPDLRGVLCHVAPSQHSETGCSSVTQQGLSDQRRGQQQNTKLPYSSSGAEPVTEAIAPGAPGSDLSGSGSQQRCRRYAWRRRWWRYCDSIPGDYHNPGPLATTVCRTTTRRWTSGSSGRTR